VAAYEQVHGLLHLAFSLGCCLNLVQLLLALLVLVLLLLVLLLQGCIAVGVCIRAGAWPATSGRQPWLSPKSCTAAAAGAAAAGLRHCWWLHTSRCMACWTTPLQDTQSRGAAAWSSTALHKCAPSWV
jgi:hypothetical protein